MAKVKTQTMIRNKVSVAQVISADMEAKEPDRPHVWNPIIDSFLKNSSFQPSMWDKQSTEHPLIIFGLSKGSKNAIRFCWDNDVPFYYIDNPYIRITELSYRITKNNLQYDGPIIKRPHDRIVRLNTKIHEMKDQEGYILVCPSSDQIMELYGTTVNDWVLDTCEEISTLTDGHVKIRFKPDRTLHKTIYDDFDDARCVVAFNSVAATEALLYGIPTITLTTNIVSALCNTSLSEINNLNMPSVKERTDFLAHLSYCQFTVHEIESGFAFRTINS